MEIYSVIFSKGRKLDWRDLHSQLMQIRKRQFKYAQGVGGCLIFVRTKSVIQLSRCKHKKTRKRLAAAKSYSDICLRCLFIDTRWIGFENVCSWFFWFRKQSRSSRTDIAIGKTFEIPQQQSKKLKSNWKCEAQIFFCGSAKGSRSLLGVNFITDASEFPRIKKFEVKTFLCGRMYVVGIFGLDSIWRTFEAMCNKLQRQQTTRSVLAYVAKFSRWLERNWSKVNVFTPVSGSVAAFSSPEIA